MLVTHSVGEAVMLSDRIVVLSPRPAEVVADIAVDLPRPRDPDMARTARFSDIADSVFAALSQGMADSHPPLVAQ